MKSLLIVYHSMTGGTLQMAQAASRGALRAPTVRVVFLHAAQARETHLLEASGYIFATPENLAAMSGQMKDFFDRTYYAGLDQLGGRPYAVLICAGSDGQNAAQQIERIATGWRLRRVMDPLIVCTNAQSPLAISSEKHIGAAALRQCEDAGATLAIGLELGIY